MSLVALGPAVMVCGARSCGVIGLMAFDDACTMKHRNDPPPVG